MEKFQFIEPEPAFDKEERQAASYIRRSFQIKKTVKRAVLDITALGVYVGYFNGTRLTEEELLPGYTDYRFRVQYQTYDVSKQIKKGKNVIAALVGDGWYRGGLGAGSTRNVFGERVKFMAHLEIEYKDGTREHVHSDASTVATQDGALRQNDLKIDEVYDARKELTGWTLPEYDDSAWHKVTPCGYAGQPIAHEGEPIRKQEVFTPTVLHTPDGATVLDFGQNMTGRVRFRVNGPEGHTVTLYMGEVLDQNGNFTLKNLTIKGAEWAASDKLQRLEYTLREGEQEYTPFFLICGFRFVKLENWPEAVAAENFQAVAIYSDLKETGTFSCSNQMVNQFVKNVRWSQKSNFVDIPTDCPTRERVGWTADISVFAATASYLTDTRKFLTKWFHDYEAAQLPDGNLPFAVPDGTKPDSTWGCMGWSNAISNVAMTLYEFYGDSQILSDVYETVRRFVEFNVNRAKKINIKSIVKPWQDRQYIIDTGFHFGEWLEPGSSMVKDFMHAMLYPDIEVTAAWFYKTAEQLAQMARILGKEEDQKRYQSLARKLKKVYRNRFIKDGQVHSKRQCRYVRPLSMDLVTDDEKQRIAWKLDQMCRDNDYKIGTGFLTTWQILTVLADNGHVETAYKMLENTERPGWLYTVKKGATTTWENWCGIDEKNVPTDSLNHYAMGAVVSWLFSHCAGIRPLQPGFAEILIKPLPGGSLTHARAEYDSQAGKIVSEWKRDGKTFTLHIETPKNRPVHVELPDGTKHETNGGKQDFECQLN